MRWDGWGRRLERQRDWHPWFAWHPVTLGKWPNPMGEAAWLETVERRIAFWPPDEITWWEYRSKV
jgi:hypothetical protein